MTTAVPRITYQIMTASEARAAGANMRAVDPHGLLSPNDYDDDPYGVFLLKNGMPIKLIGTDGGEPEDQTLARNLSWIDGALDQAYALGLAHGAELQ
jgi:hypothetical protein